MYKIIANWKMYLTIQESRNLAASLAQWWSQNPAKNAEMVVCPSNLALHDVLAQFDDSGIAVGVQDISISQDLGAFTGQTAAQQIKETNAQYAIIGHSEMRQFYQVNDEMVAQQLQVCLQNDIDPIICIGETKEERDNGKTDHLLVSQLHTILGNAEGELKSIQIAYEPRWAIGTGNPVNPEEAERVHQLIKHTLKEYIPADTDIPILYGGSVNAENILSFLEQGSVDGALIGSASANESSLREIIETLAKLNN